jgi:hypothetical protein
MHGSNSLIPEPKNPFYIITPPYTRISAGVTVLHLLCHYLNMAGENAFIVHYPPNKKSIRNLPGYASLQFQPEVPLGMLTPLITQDVIDAYDEQKLNPIVIYPEVFDNPLNASFFGRYILNYPGKLNTQYKEKENFAFAYTQILAEYCSESIKSHGKVIDVLFIPTTDLSFWKQPEGSLQRAGSCYYSGKLSDIHNLSTENLPNKSIEIKRDINMSRKEIRTIFQTSEKFYCYEDSALAIEAQLCGCETIFVRNKMFSGVPLASKELGLEAKYSTSSNSQTPLDALQYAKILDDNLRKRATSIPLIIANLALKWRKIARSADYTGTISYPFKPIMIFMEAGIEQSTEPTTDDKSVIPNKLEKLKSKAKAAIKSLLSLLEAR